MREPGPGRARCISGAVSPHMIVIRPATHDDAEALPAIERASGELFRGWPGLEWIADDAVQSVERHRELIASGIALVAVDARTGHAAGFLNAEQTHDGDIHLWQIAVDPAYQRQGIGSRLIAEARAIAEKRGAPAMTLTTFRDVAWNEPYYRRIGFRVLSEDALSPRLRGLLDDETAAGLPRVSRCAMVLPL